MLALAGGAYKVFTLARSGAPRFFGVLPSGWRAIGVFEVLCAILLVIPAAANWMTVLTPLAAAALALESLALGGLYARYSLKLTAANPLVWVAVMAVIAAFVAWGRYALRPLA